MSVYRAGVISGPGGSVAFRLTGPALLAQAGAYRAALQRALTATAGRIGGDLKRRAAGAYAGTRFAPLFAYRTSQTPFSTVTLWNTSPIFQYVEYATRPHKIRARRAPFLVFQVGGRWVRVKEVNHPGTKGRYALARIFADVEPQWRAAMLATAREVLTRGLD